MLVFEEGHNKNKPRREFTFPHPTGRNEEKQTAGGCDLKRKCLTYAAAGSAPVAYAVWLAATAAAAWSDS